MCLKNGNELLLQPNSALIIPIYAARPCMPLARIP